MSKYSKPPLKYNEQIDSLKQRGLLFCDEKEALNILKKIGYYRFQGYSSHFFNVRKVFNDKTYFEEVVQVYELDRKLRILILDAIERIEIAIKAYLIDKLSIKYSDPHWFLKKNLFNKKFNHKEFVFHIRSELKIDRGRKEKHVDGYIKKYKIPELPPAWIVFQSLSFGTISRLYSSLRSEAKILISEEFNVSHYILESWLQSLSFLRNLCAHHSKIWDKVYIFKPKKMSDFAAHFEKSDKIYTQIFVLYFLLKKIAPETKWNKDLFTLMEEFNEYKASMGFSQNWKNDNFWKR